MSQPDLFTPKTLSVSELTQDIKGLLEGNFLDIRVEGEVSNTSTSRSGHTYFTIKDEDAQLSCVIWRGVNQRLDIELADGQQIVASGDIQVYPPHGKYQLIVRSVEQAGKGALQEAFEKLKKELKAEGLFEDKHKKELPAFPFSIGVITSATGAAFHDIRDTLQRRWPAAKVLLRHASVQGVNAAPEIVKGINWFSDHQNVDVLIVGRGGGSLEDLWPFNEEAVARALYNCKLPTISAVGHEVDFSISDFVADARAATPTQAAIVVAPDISEVRMRTDDLNNRLHTVVEDHLANQKERIQQLVDSHALQAVQQKVSNLAERTHGLTERLNHRREVLFIKKNNKLEELQHRLELKNPSSPLKQGFARIWQDDDWVQSSDQFNSDQSTTIEWKDGKAAIEK